MIEVNIIDRDFLRFLWWADREKESFKIFRHVRVVFGATSSPFTLGAVLEYHLTHVEGVDRDLALTLLESFYVDNCVLSVNSDEEYHAFKLKATALLAEAKMDLRLWMSNTDADTEDLTVSVLGLRWNRKEDVLFVDLSSCSLPINITKRNILSAVQKIFDPIGFTYPATVSMRILLQDAWLRGTKWDDLLPEEIKGKFITWYEEIESLQNIKIPRLVTVGKSDRVSWTLHVFTDASQRAYGASVLLRIVEDGNISLHFIAAKARVAPLKKASIPRLELLGCLIRSYLMDMVRKGLRLDEFPIPIYFWTDSTTALAWIRRDDCWATFVGNRVNKIRQLTNVNDWWFIPGQLNHADFLTRGCSPTQLLQSKWWEGPSWLLGEEQEWSANGEKVNEEMVAQEKRKTVQTVSLSIMDEVKYDYTYPQYVRIRAWIIRFLENCRTVDARHKGALVEEEERKAELSLIREMQEGKLVEEELPVNTVRDKRGLLRVKTRIILRDDLLNFRYPYLLPKNHPLVFKLIQNFHEMNCHAGVSTLMSIIREKFWIIQCRRTIQKVIHKCVTCKKFRAKPVTVEMAPLPEDRIKDAEPFQIIGVDLAGPLMLRNGSKSWIAIFTCAVYRAVHFEVVTSLSTKAFLQAMRRFVNKYRRPEVVYSDNGTNFVGSVNYFKTLNLKELGMETALKPIKWKFNVPLAAWWGGMWERMIRSLKDLLRRKVGKASLTKQELEITVKEVEEVMNKRPLTYMSEDPEDLSGLTPFVFLKPHGDFRFPEGDCSEAQRMRVRAKYVEELKTELRDRFRKEYLGQLKAPQSKRKHQKSIEVGDLVLLEQENKSRIDWPLARVLALVPGKDGLARVAHVKTADGHFTRPVQRLYNLELDQEEQRSWHLPSSLGGC